MPWPNVVMACGFEWLFWEWVRSFLGGTTVTCQAVSGSILKELSNRNVVPFKWKGPAARLSQLSSRMLFFITALLEPCTVFLIFIPFGTIISAWHCVPGHQTGKHPIGQRGPRGADRLWVEQGVPGWRGTIAIGREMTVCTSVKLNQNQSSE